MGIYWKCSICHRETGVSILKKGSEDTYICYDCKRSYNEEPKIFGKKTRRKAKRKAQQVGRPC